MRERGTVVDWRGAFGFIKPASGALNVFFHHTALQMEGYRQCFKGDLVEYEAESWERGIRAVRVKVIEPAEAAA
jgi:cold shock CspA family protein